MTKYKAGALSAFLSGEPIDDDLEESKSDQFEKKKPKKEKKKRKSVVKFETPTIEEPEASQKDEESEEKDEGTILDDSKEPSTKKKRSQSYAKTMSDDETKRTLFVGNLPVNVTEKTLKRLFSSCGTIDTIRLRSAIPNKLHMPKKAAVIKRNFSESQDTINAYIKFQAAESVPEAQKMNGTLVDGRHLQVDSCASGKRYDDRRTVFLGNVSYDANEEDLYEHFADCGDIEKVRLVRNRTTGGGKGFGFVVFKDPTSVSFALKLNGEKFKDRELRITRVVKKQKMKSSPSNNKRSDGSFKSRKKFQHDKTTKAKTTGWNEKSPRHKSAGSADSTRQKPSKGVRQLIKKRKSKKDKKSYTATV